MSKLVKKVIYFLRLLKLLKRYKKKYSNHIKNEKLCFKKKKQSYFYLYIKYKIIKLNLS